MIHLVSQPPVTHPTVQFCSGPDIVCSANWDSLVSSAIAVLVTLVVAAVVVRKVSSRNPGWLQVGFEIIASYTRGLINDMVSPDAMFIMPIALTIFLYILVANWIGFFPLPEPLHPANSDLNQTLAMSVLVIVVVQWYSLKTLGLYGYLYRLTKPFDAPMYIRIPFILLNIIEDITKPLTLALRLMGNILGGLIMAWVLTSLLPLIPLPTWIGGHAFPTILSVILLGAWKAFDVFFIGTIQAYIFFLLTLIYFEMAREGLHEVHERRAGSADRGGRVASVTQH
ncbi:MAG TPA: F0F1 ATP synthase subunit A [Candidatus Dormibacteraeota bacterium]|nr:F0F1 ATP synthase subunit A [Candidatus Dormibacteraeota bacterium]